MLERQKRLNEVYEHLHNYCGVHTKGDFADKIDYARAYISSALNGNEKYLTDKLFTKICEVYPFFNLNYLLNGEGKLLKSDQAFLDFERELKSAQGIIDRFDAPSEKPQAIDYSFLIEKAVEKATAYADKTIASLEARIKDKDKYIELLEKRIVEYEAAATFIQENNVLEKWPFPKGVADEIKKRKELRV